MGKTHARGRAVALGFVLAVILLTRPFALALNPRLDASQYAHTAWKVREGFTKGFIYAITQTPDGYLWFATEFGLLRFDGVRNVPWQPPQGQKLPSTDIRALLSARDGTLWIGTGKGLASWKDGKLTQYRELAGYIVVVLVEDREGSVWAGAWGCPPADYAQFRMAKSTAMEMTAVLAWEFRTCLCRGMAVCGEVCRTDCGDGDLGLQSSMPCKGRRVGYAAWAKTMTARS